MSAVVQQDPQLMAVNPPLVQGSKDLHDLTDQISSVVEAKVYETPLKYWITLMCTGSVVLLLGAMLTYLVSTGIGVWGNNRPVGCAWDITNLVFLLCLGHAAPLLSA